MSLVGAPFDDKLYTWTTLSSGPRPGEKQEGMQNHDVRECHPSPLGGIPVVV